MDRIVSNVEGTIYNELQQQILWTNLCTSQFINTSTLIKLLLDECQHLDERPFQYE
jgi:hypothetical protein